MLAARLMGEARLWNRAHVIVPRLADDPGADRAIEGVQEHLVDKDLLRTVSYEALVDAAREIDALASWADAFERRYLDAKQIGS
jgi:hypothetical protein